MTNFSEYLHLFAVNYDLYLGRLINIVVILSLAYLTAKLVRRAAARVEQRAIYDRTFHQFLLSVGYFTIKVFCLMLILENLGVDVSSLIALFGAAGFGVGLSLKSTLSNFAGGFSILMFKTIRVGEIIETREGKGVIDNIEMTHTKLITEDGNHLYIPNGTLVSLSIKKILSKQKLNVDDKNYARP